MSTPRSREPAARPEQRAPAVAVLIGVLLVVGAAVGFTRGGGDAPTAAGAPGDPAPSVDRPGPYRTAPPPPSRARLTDTFAAMTDAVAERSAADFVDAAGSTAWARITWRNLAALGIVDVSLRVVGTGPAGTPGLHEATVEVSWAPGDAGVYDGARTSPQAVTFMLRSTGVEALQVRGAAASTDFRAPLWLLGPLEVTELERAAAVVVGATPTGLGQEATALTRRALAAVDETLSRLPASMRRRLVVVAPARTREAAQLLGRPAPLLADTAAATATVDGSPDDGAPVQVVLNPAELDRLDLRGAQVVVTHEAVHAVTGAAAVDMPLWVAEGFADWVALRDSSVPVRVAAAGLVGSVRADGLPRSLPGSARFDPQAGDATESYEAAWTAFRALDRRVGDAAVVGFYVDVLRGMPVASALRRNAGLGVAALTAAWRADLKRIARG